MAEFKREDAHQMLQALIEWGLLSEPVCNTHNGLPCTEEEDAEWEDGYDPCIPAVRIWEEAWTDLTVTH